MADVLTEHLPMKATPTFLPRITRNDGRSIEQAIASPNLFDPGVSLEGGILESAYADSEPPILGRLRDDGVPYVIDPQTSRFVGERFLETAALAALPYSPHEVLTPGQTSLEALDALALGVMRHQQELGAAAFLAAGLPYADNNLQACLRANDRLLETSARANGSGEFERRPLIAQVLVGRQAMANPKLILNRLLDYPVAAAYVQHTRLRPTRDGIEKLTRYVELLLQLQEAGVRVIAGRVGAFGLILAALGIAAFDSGLGQAEGFDLAGLNRRLTQRDLERRAEGNAGGGDQRVYFGQLLTTVKGRQADAILGERGLRARMACQLGCCRHRVLEDLPDRRRQHYLWVRYKEITELRDFPSNSLRVDWVHEQLRNAREASTAVRRALLDKEVEPPDFGHLDRWIGVLGRGDELRAAV